MIPITEPSSMLGKHVHVDPQEEAQRKRCQVKPIKKELAVCRIPRSPKGVDHQAKILTDFIRESIAKSAYTKMINGSYYSSIQSSIRPKSAIDTFRTRSCENLNSLRKLIYSIDGAFKTLEYELFLRITNENKYMIHFSDNPNLLMKCSNSHESFVRLLSRDKLKAQKMQFSRDNTTSSDISLFNTTAFVFFSLAIEEISKTKSRFGSHAYSVNIKPCFFEKNRVFMTLGDSGMLRTDFDLIRGDLKRVYRAFESLSTNMADLQEDDENKENLQLYVNYYFGRTMDQLHEALSHHFLMGGDILPGLALITILFKRLVEKALVHATNYNKVSQEFAQSFTKCIDSIDNDKLLNALMTGFVSPICQVPCFVVSRDVRHIYLEK